MGKTEYHANLNLLRLYIYVDLQVYTGVGDLGPSPKSPSEVTGLESTSSPQDVVLPTPVQFIESLNDAPEVMQ